MKVLHLTLKKKWFDMIASGEKKEEYREIKPHWVSIFYFLKSEFKQERFGIYYKAISKAFAYCLGYKGNRVDGLKFLLSNNGEMKQFDVIQFRNGYSKNAPSITLEFKGIEIGNAKPEWSDNWQGQVFIIKLGEILNPQTPNQ